LPSKKRQANLKKRVPMVCNFESCAGASDVIVVQSVY